MTSALTQRIIADIIVWIDNNLNDKLTVERVAEISGYSSRHFQKLFKATTGESVGIYIRKRKMILAAQLLLDSELTITEIYCKIGYAEPFTFNRTFKKTYLLSPTQFRNIHKNSSLYFYDSK